MFLTLFYDKLNNVKNKNVRIFVRSIRDNELKGGENIISVPHKPENAQLTTRDEYFLVNFLVLT